MASFQAGHGVVAGKADVHDRQDDRERLRRTVTRPVLRAHKAQHLPRTMSVAKNTAELR